MNLTMYANLVPNLRLMSAGVSWTKEFALVLIADIRERKPYLAIVQQRACVRRCILFALPSLVSDLVCSSIRYRPCQGQCLV